MTYQEARRILFLGLRQRGWAVNEGLKVPHATSPDQTLRVWFKTQAVYYATGDGRSAPSFQGALSLWVDIRQLAELSLKVPETTALAFERYAQQFSQA